MSKTLVNRDPTLRFHVNVFQRMMGCLNGQLNCLVKVLNLPGMMHVFNTKTFLKIIKSVE
jgi:hypothetical protein